MYPIFFTLSALLSLAAVHATDKLSGVSGRAFDCPTKDLGNFPLGDHSNDGVTLFCSYPAFPGVGSAGDFSCKYDSTGALVEDSNTGFCPKAAISKADHNGSPPQTPPIPTTTPVTHAPMSDEL